jgi:hypothetical protein
MPTELVASLVSAAVALLIAVASGSLTWTQVRRERRKWLVDAKVSLSVETHKVRLASYPAAFRALAALSHGSANRADSDKAGEVATALNDWLYSAGGMCASAVTRGAILGLRQICRRWSKDGGDRPEELYGLRNLALSALRLDLDLPGLESYDFDDSATLLRQLQDDVHQMESRRPVRRAGNGRPLGSGLTRPSGQASTATVSDVPKSTPSR